MNEDDLDSNTSESVDLILVSFPAISLGWTSVVMTRDEYDELCDFYEDAFLVEFEDDEGNTIVIDLSEAVHSAQVHESPSSEMIEWVRDFSRDSEFFRKICFEPEPKIYSLTIAMCVRIIPLIHERDGFFSECSTVLKLGTVLYDFVIGERHFRMIASCKNEVITVNLQYDGVERIFGDDSWIEHLASLINGIEVSHDTDHNYNITTLSQSVANIDINELDAFDDHL